MPDHAVIPPFADSRLPHVGTYRRVLPVSLQRMYENALDWEHLPHVHRSSFSAIECLAAGPWGWRARTLNARDEASVIELRLDRACRRWITRTLSGRNAGAEIWTHAFPIGDARVDIVVDFFVPGVAAEAREKVGGAFAGLYEQLYDEDVAMMVERQRRLDQRLARAHDAPSEVALGPRETLELPMDVTVGGRSFVLCEVDGSLVVFPALCPHQLGPLARAPVIDGVVTCPWHGYRFDVRTGDCLTGQTCRLADRPTVQVRDGRVVISERR
ncbi:MAG: Rieske (2Fe-2S) protein [Pseudomonadales bacterium]|jgi:nitrite reductase/ring-hydroxylating ferredoxin subunit